MVLADDYKKLGFEVKITTEDGAVGTQGLVTSLLKDYFEAASSTKFKFMDVGQTL